MSTRYTSTLARATLAALIVLSTAVQAGLSAEAVSVEGAASKLSLSRPCTVQLEFATASEERAVAFREHVAKVFPRYTFSRSKRPDSQDVEWTVSATKTGVFTLEQIKALVLPMEGIAFRNSGSLKWTLSQTHP